MNTDKYFNNKPYPTKKEFTVKYWYRAGKVVCREMPNGTQFIDPEVGVTIELGACVKEEAVDREAYRAATQAYGAETARLTEQFKQDLFVELGIVGNPKADKLYSIAWAHGHSAGFSEVLSYAWDLVDLIKD